MAEKEESVDLTIIKTEVLDRLTWAHAIDLKEESDWIQAREARRTIALHEKQIDKHFKRVKAPINAAHKGILAIEKEYAVPIAMVLNILDKKILTFEEEYFAERALLARQLQAAELDRAETERLHHADELQKAGDYAASAALMDQPLRVPQVVVPEYSGWLPGEDRAEVWKVEEETIDIMALARAVIDGTVAAACIVPNVAVLNTLAKALGPTFNVPGCKAQKHTEIKQR